MGPELCDHVHKKCVFFIDAFTYPRVPSLFIYVTGILIFSSFNPRSLFPFLKHFDILGRPLRTYLPGSDASVAGLLQSLAVGHSTHAGNIQSGSMCTNRQLECTLYNQGQCVQTDS